MHPNVKTLNLVKLAFYAVSIILIIVIAFDYTKYFLQVESVKNIEMDVETPQFSRKEDDTFFSFQLNFLNNGRGQLYLSTIRYELFRKGEMIRLYVEDFSASELNVPPHGSLKRSVSMEVPTNIFTELENGTLIPYTVKVRFSLKTYFGTVPQVKEYSGIAPLIYRSS